MTKGIKVSCQHKRDIYTTIRNNNDLHLKAYYKNSCKILSRVITTAKKLHYNGLISNSNNKVKATWKVIRSISGRNNNKADIQFLKIDGKLTDNNVIIAESLNKYILIIADNIKRVTDGHITGCDPANHAKYMTQAFVNSFPKIYFNHTTYKEIESIIRSFKPKYSNGYDEILVKILKCSVPFISSPLAYICNRALVTGVFATRLKY
jgi:hypothetical protein